MSKNIDNQKYAQFAGEMLKKVREIRGLSQQEVAELIGISKATVEKIEGGQWNFSINFFFMYAEKLGFYVLLEGKESDSPMAEMMRTRWTKNTSKN